MRDFKWISNPRKKFLEVVAERWQQMVAVGVGVGPAKMKRTDKRPQLVRVNPDDVIIGINF